MSLKDLISAEQFDKPTLELFLKSIDGAMGIPYGAGIPQLARPKRIALLFYGGVTRRTYDSFVMAIQDLGWTRVGGSKSTVDEEPLESLERAVQFYGRRCDAIVLRHRDANAQAQAAGYAKVPIISAGGSKEGEHPTQALGDYAALHSVLKGIKGKPIAFVGDLKNSSSVHSLCYLLRHEPPKEVYLVSPPGKGLQDQYVKLLPHVRTVAAVDDLPKSVRALYLVQSPGEPDRVRFSVNKGVLDRFENVRVLHPLPEGPELPRELLKDPRVVVDQQLVYADFARMACLELITGQVRTFK